MKFLSTAAVVLAVSASAAAAQEGKICISTWDLANSYWVNLVNGAQERANELGLELLVNDPSNDVGRQIAAVENFVTIGCGAIIIAAIDPASMGTPLSEAQAAGVKVIAQSIETPVADVWASADEYDMGYTIGIAAGEWLAANVTDAAEVLVLNNDRIPQMIARKEGIIAGIHEKSPSAKIVAEQGAQSTAEAMTVTESVLQANPGLDAAVAINDSQALGALAAVESSGIATDGFFVGGIDATPEARTLIEGGSAFRASVDNVPFANGRQDVDIAVSLIKGDKLEYRQVIAVEVYTGK
ncbi:MAG: sugar ABC transporter substrate-binding protein [Pseudomonadota bacterium]